MGKIVLIVPLLGLTAGIAYLIESGNAWVLFALGGAFVALTVLVGLLHVTQAIASSEFEHRIMNPSLYDGSRYTTPEVEANGTIIAYRFFGVTKDGVLTSLGNGRYVDGGTYPGGFKRSDRVPTLKNMNGIYAAKTPDSPILNNYDFGGNVLAQVKLSGRIIEGELGYRAQYCEVVKVLR